jgi:Gram-negative bacterial TonB protein C-terminal
VNINRHSVAAVAASFFPGLLLALPCFALTPQFVSPKVVAAGNVPFPLNTLAAGTVSFLVHLDENAHVQGIEVTRDFSPFTQPALAAIRDWSFSPALLDGKPVPSTTPIAVIFNVFDPNGVKFFGLKLPPSAPAYPDALRFTPPQLLSAEFARYPVKALAAGTVVLDVALNRSGAVEGIRPIRGVPPLTSAAVSATKGFAFSAAEFRGQPVASHIAIAFVFQYNNPVPSRTN